MRVVNARRSVASRARSAVCIRCRCDEEHACEGADGFPCHWVVVDHKRRIGICSECAMFLLIGLLEGHH